MIKTIITQSVYIIVIFILQVVFSWWYALLYIPYLILLFMFVRSKGIVKRDISSNGTIDGAKGSGKTQLMVIRASMDKVCYSNIPLANALDFNLKTFYDSVLPNNVLDAIKGNFTVVNKPSEYEGVNRYADDMAIYMANYMDSDLKKYYPSMGFELPLERQLFNSFTIFSAQQRSRLYKIARELSTDFAITCHGVKGYSKLWFLIPYLGLFQFLNYTWYDNIDSAEQGKQPFSSLGLFDNAGQKIKTSMAMAMKKAYEAEFGKIVKRTIVFNGYSKKLKYDTRYFHEKIFGYPASEIKKK